MHSRMTIGDFISEKKPEKVIDVVMTVDSDIWNDEVFAFGHWGRNVK